MKIGDRVRIKVSEWSGELWWNQEGCIVERSTSYLTIKFDKGGQVTFHSCACELIKENNHPHTTLFK